MVALLSTPVVGTGSVDVAVCGVCAAVLAIVQGTTPPQVQWVALACTDCRVVEADYAVLRARVRRIGPYLSLTPTRVMTATVAAKHSGYGRIIDAR